MNEKFCQQIDDYIQKFNENKQLRLKQIRNLIHEANFDVKEKIWAQIPSFYVNKKMIKFLAFSDHINIFAEGVRQYQDKLTNYKITEKGTLQIFDHQLLPNEILKLIFIESL